MKAIDWSFSDLPVEDMPRWGYEVAFRYLCYHNTNSMPKILTPEKRDRILKVMDLIPNWEWYESRSKEGGRAGRQDGEEAHRQLVDLAYPTGRMIVVSDDSYTDSSNIASVLEYLKGFQATCPSYPVSVYGNQFCVDAVFAELGTRGWQNRENHRSGVSVSPNAFAYQNGNYAYQQGADENDLFPPFTSWKRGTPAAPPPVPITAPATPTAPKGSDVMQGYVHRQVELIRGKQTDVYYLVAMDLSTRVTIQDANTLSGLLATKQYIGPTTQGFNHLSQAQVARIPVVIK